MSRTRQVKLFTNGASQAVRLPAEFRFAGTEIYATRDDATGDVLLSSRPRIAAWEDFFREMEGVAVPEDFMAERPMNRPADPRGVFDDDA